MLLPHVSSERSPVALSLSKEVFHADHGLWLATAAHELFPNPHGYAKEQYQLEWFRFLGRILGKALYEGILLDVRFAGFFLAKWLGRQSYRKSYPLPNAAADTDDGAVDDLASLDEDLYHGLLALKNYPGDVENDLALDFSVSEEGGFACTRCLIVLFSPGDDRARRLAHYRPHSEWTQRACHQREQDQVHLPRVALPTQLANRQAMLGVLLGAVRDCARTLPADVQRPRAACPRR